MISKISSKTIVETCTRFFSRKTTWRTVCLHGGSRIWTSQADVPNDPVCSENTPQLFFFPKKNQRIGETYFRILPICHSFKETRIKRIVGVACIRSCHSLSSDFKTLKLSRPRPTNSLSERSFLVDCRFFNLSSNTSE